MDVPILYWDHAPAIPQSDIRHRGRDREYRQAHSCCSLTTQMNPNKCSSKPRIWNFSLLSCMTLWDIIMKQLYKLFPGKRGQFPFRIYGCERRYFSNARTGKSSGFFGFEYTCHLSRDLSPDWSPFVLENKTPDHHSTTKHELHSCWGSYCFAQGGSTPTW